MLLVCLEFFRLFIFICGKSNLVRKCDASYAHIAQFVIPTAAVGYGAGVGRG